MADKKETEKATHAETGSNHDTNTGAEYANNTESVSHASGTGADLEASDLFVWKTGDVRYYDKDGHPVNL